MKRFAFALALILAALLTTGPAFAQSAAGVVYDATQGVILLASPGAVAGAGGANCKAATTGAIRYNSSTNVLQFCNGTTWGNVSSGGGGTPAGSNTQVQFNNSGAFGADSNFVWDNTNKRLGIGTTPSYALDLNGGEARATDFISTSDRRLKKNIRPVEGLAIVEKLNGVRFDWRSNGKPDVGVIAQDVEAVLPEAVKTDPKTGYKSVEYGNLIAPLIEAIKELEQENRQLSERVHALENRAEPKH